MTVTIELAGRAIGAGAPCLVIAEAGVNHNGREDLAGALVDAAAAAGADAVKFQIFKADRLVQPDAPKAAYQLDTTGPAQSQLEMLRGLELSVAAHRRLKERAERQGLIFLSTPFDEASATALAELGVGAIKLGSGELTNRFLLEHVAGLGLPLILSTGMATLGEAAAAVEVVRRAGAGDVALLHCLSQYPAPADQVNLRAMIALGGLGLPVGYSDHTAGIGVALAAVALGACIIEKHFTLDRSLPGPDHQASLEPPELTALVRGIREVEAALGDGDKTPAPAEMANRDIIRRSLAASRDLPAGTILERAHLCALRPAHGVSPMDADTLIGRRLVRDVARGELLMRGLVE